MSTVSRLGRPRLYNAEGDRRSSWLELFFDLVFVVAVSRLAHLLHDDHSLEGVATFFGLFLAVWWLWISFSYYADIFDAHDLWDKAAMFAAMLGATVLAVTLDGGVAEDSSIFAGTFGVLFGLLAVLYAYAGRSEPAAAELSRWYVTGSLTGSVLWFASLAVAPPGRYAVWALALVLNAAISGPVAYARMTSAPRQVSHMPERFGLFIIVVLGEAVLAIVDGNTATPWDDVSTVVAVLGFLLAVGIWWVYFANFDERLIDRALSEGRAAQTRSFVYGYGHLVLYAAIAAFGVGLELAIEESAEQAGVAVNWVAMGSIAVYLLMLTAAQLAVRHPLAPRLVAVRLAVAGALLVLALVGAPVLPALVVATVLLGAVVTLESARATAAAVSG